MSVTDLGYLQSSVPEHFLKNFLVKEKFYEVVGPYKRSAMVIITYIELTESDAINIVLLTDW